jgi:hypothetical protein
MSEWWMHVLRHVLNPATPLLPAMGVMQASLCLSWGLVLAALGAMVLGPRLGRRPVLWSLPVLLAVWPWLPGTVSASYWLGLAFQAPSVSAVLLSALVLHARWSHPLARGEGGRWVGAPMAWMLASLGVLLGWALLLDTLALLPVQLYAWGFSPAAVALAVLLALAPWVLVRAVPVAPAASAVPDSGVLAGLVPVAVAVFVILRLPSGNLWDAVLDPWLWVVLQFLVLRKLVICYKKRSCLRTFDEG